LKITGCILWILLTAIACNGQSLLRIDCGINHSHFLSRDETSSGSSPSGEHNAPELGLFYKGTKKKIFSIGIELNYRRKSAFLNENSGGLGGGEIVNGNFNLDYLSLMALPEIHLGSGHLMEWYLNAGYYFGMLIHSDCSGTLINWSIMPNSTTSGPIGGSASPYFQKGDRGWCSNSGVIFNVNPDYAFTINANALFGRQNTSAIGNYLVSFDWGITAGVMIHLKNFNLLNFDNKKHHYE
jgi:hypothetical protein